MCTIEQWYNHIRNSPLLCKRQQLCHDDKTPTLIRSCPIHGTLYRLLSDFIKAFLTHIDACLTAYNLSVNLVNAPYTQTISGNHIIVSPKSSVQINDVGTNKVSYNITTITEVSLRIERDNLATLEQFENISNAYTWVSTTNSKLPSISRYLRTCSDYDDILSCPVLENLYKYY